MLNQILAGIGSVTGVNLITGFISGVATSFVLGKITNIIVENIEKWFANFDIAVDMYIERKIKSPFIRDIVKGQIIALEKTMKGSSGKEKFNQLKKMVLDKCPDILDKHVDRILQEIYNQALKNEGK